MRLIILAVLIIIAIATARAARQARIPDAVKAERFESRKRGNSEAKIALLIGVPVLVVLYALSHGSL
jgi:hypothetical protein